MLLLFLLPLIVVCVLRRRQLNPIDAFLTPGTQVRPATMEYG